MYHNVSLRLFFESQFNGDKNTPLSLRNQGNGNQYNLEIESEQLSSKLDGQQGIKDSSLFITIDSSSRSSRMETPTKEEGSCSKFKTDRSSSFSKKYRYSAQYVPFCSLLFPPVFYLLFFSFCLPFFIISCDLCHLDQQRVNFLSYISSFYCIRNYSDYTSPLKTPTEEIVEEEEGGNYYKKRFACILILAKRLTLHTFLSDPPSVFIISVLIFLSLPTSLSLF